MARELVIAPYIPDRTEILYVASGAWADVDIGKAVTLRDASTVELADSGDEIYGFVTAVEAYTDGGYKVGSVACDSGREMWATDESGSLAVGTVVKAGTATAVGTALTAHQKVVTAGNAAAQGAIIQKWVVVSTSGGAAGSEILLRKV
jgi:hypothetical protein